MQMMTVGDIPMHRVQQIALAAMQSSNRADVNDLASLGAFGNSPSNIHRDLMRSVFSDVVEPEPFNVKTRLQAVDGVKDRDCAILYPHDWIVHLAELGLLSKVMGLPAVTSFWEQQDFENNPQFTACGDFFRNLNWQEEIVIPLLLHGDAAPHTENDSVLAFSMRSILATNSVQLSQLLLFLMAKSTIVDGSLEPVWKEMVWSFTALTTGVHPDRDSAGRRYATMTDRTPEQEKRHRLAGNWLAPGHKKVKAVVMVFAADIEFFCQQFGFPYAMENHPCPYCRCDNLHKNSKAPFTDFSKDAAWKTKMVPLHELLEKYGKHPLMQVPGFSFQTLKLDTLHILDLGVACHVYGNLLWEIIEDELPGSRQTCMVELNRLIQSAYDDLGVPAQQRVGRLNISNISKQGQSYPCVAHVKGRRVRMFSEVAIKLAEQFVSPMNKASQHRLALVKSLNEMYKITDLPLLVWPSDVQNKFEASVNAALAHYAFLAHNAMSKGLFRYSIVQKFHLTAHLPAQTQFLAPRCYWCYGGESFMGYMVKMAATCVHSTPAFKIAPKVYQKLRLSLHLSWEHGVLFDED